MKLGVFRKTDLRALIYYLLWRSLRNRCFSSDLRR
jgi:hypothetical protein